MPTCAGPSIEAVAGLGSHWYVALHHTWVIPIGSYECSRIFIPEIRMIIPSDTEMGMGNDQTAKLHGFRI